MERTTVDIHQYIRFIQAHVSLIAFLNFLLFILNGIWWYRLQLTFIDTLLTYDKASYELYEDARQVGRVREQWAFLRFFARKHPHPLVDRARRRAYRQYIFTFALWLIIMALSIAISEVH